MIRRLIASACAALLTACGGGESPRVAPITQSASQQRTILFVGDSTFTRYWSDQVSTPDRIAQMTGTRVQNLAVSGTTACDAPLEQIRAARADIVVSGYGLNDAYGNAGAPRNSLAAYATCLRAIAAAADDAGSVLVWLAANPILPSPGWDASRIHTYNAVTRGVGSYYCAQPDLAWSLTYLPDGQHPSPAAIPAIASSLAICIERADQ